MRNCPNCGAPFEPEHSKCKYCGTSVLDFTGIDFTNGQPIYLIMRTEQYVNGEYTPVEITQKAIPRLDTIEIQDDYSCMTDTRGNIITRIRNSSSCTTNVSFTGIAMEDGSLYKVKI